MDQKISENTSEITQDLKSSLDETSAKTIHQQNLEKGNRTRISKTVAYSLLGALSMVLIIVIFILPSLVKQPPDNASVIQDNTSATAIDLSVLAQKPIAQAMFQSF